MSARYGIYYAPAQDHALSAAAAAWLGRDAWTGAAIMRPAVMGLGDQDPDALTADPRHYGFHATLKAPFELAEGQREAELDAAVAAIASSQAAFNAPIAVQALGEFVAFRLSVPAPAMQFLHETCVRALEPFRAPLGEADLARRRRARMNADQDARLVAFGYPWIFEDFRFHMTLTGRIREEGSLERVVAALSAHFAAFNGPHLFDGLCLFRQPDRASPFTVIARHSFATTRLAVPTTEGS
jgi:putative phosphonate metabolism protein